jgi:hypothetical protein
MKQKSESDNIISVFPIRPIFFAIIISKKNLSARQTVPNMIPVMVDTGILWIKVHNRKVKFRE